MKYTLNKQIKTMDDTPIREMDSRMASAIIRQCAGTLETLADEETVSKFKEQAPANILGEAITYRQVMRQALMNFNQEEKPSEKDQLARYDLLMKLAADRVELESSEITTIRNAVAANYKHPIIVGRVRDLLEGKTKEPPKEKNAKKKK